MRGKSIIAVFIIFSFLFAAVGCSFNKNYDHPDDKFKPGQVWKYNTRLGEDKSTIQILKVENYPEEGVLIHITVRDIEMKSYGKTTETIIEHQVFKKSALEKSVTDIVTENEALPDFSKFFDGWKKAYKNKSASIADVDVSTYVASREKLLSMSM